MATITLYEAGKPHEYANAHDVAISPAGVLTFYWETTDGGGHRKPQAFKVQTSVPFTVVEDVASG